MLTHPLLQQMKSLRLHGMAEALEEQINGNTSGDSVDERLAFLLDREAAIRSNKALYTRLKRANLHISDATVANIDYKSTRNLEKKRIDALAGGQWLDQKQNLIVTGATGTGKTYLACALAHKACMMGYKAQYFRTTRLIEELMIAKSDGRYLKIIKGFDRLNVLVIDDWAMVKLSGAHQQIMLDILDDRYQKKSTIIASQLPATAWYEQIQDVTFADAILDRMTGNAQIIQLNGPSLRKEKSVQNET